MGNSLKEQFPLRLFLGQEDATFLLDDNFTLSNVDPGGYEMCSIAIPKDMPDTLRGMPVRFDCGLAVAWEGRIADVQRSLGNRTLITGEGNGAIFKDNETGMVFVDRDLTRWQQPSIARQIALVTANDQFDQAQVAADPGNNKPALAQIITDSWVSPYTPVVESWYDAGALNLAQSVYYDFVPGTNVSSGVGFIASISLSSDDIATSTETTGQLLSGTSEAANYFLPATPHRYANAAFRNSITPAGAQGAQYSGYWHNLAVYGNHGLTGRGTDPVGFYPSDIAAWAATQAPGIQRGVIFLTDAAGYIVPHSVYYQPVSLDTIVGDMATAQGWHWGVWEAPNPRVGDQRPRFDFRPRPGPGTFTASCNRGQCDMLDIHEALADQYDTAVVTYTDAAGVQQAVSVTADNPILDQVGLHRTVELNGGLMSSAAATIFGQEALALLRSQARVAGSIEISQAIDGINGPRAPWLLRAGIDRLRVTDLPSFDAWGAYNDVPLTRVELSASAAGWVTSLEVGSGANLVETLQSRLAAAATLAGQGG